MPNHIVLIAPTGIQLQPIAQQVADRLQLPLYTIDNFDDQDWIDLGYDASADINAFAQGGIYASYQLLMPMRLCTVEKLLSYPERGIIALPPDFVIYEDEELHKRLMTLLADLSHVILLTPSSDAEETATLLDADLANFPDWSIVNAYWVQNPSNERLAKHLVYTQGKTAEQTRDDILQLTKPTLHDDIILIGPKLTGKTTVGRLLADALSLPQVSLDMIGHRYLSETDYDRAEAHKRHQQGGILEWLHYMRPYEVHIVERVLSGEHHGVIDFGGGHSVYDDEIQFERVQKVLAPYANVILILPSPDKDESIKILKQRFEADLASEKKVQRLLVTHPSYQQLAKQIVYTKDKAQDAIQTEIFHIVG